MATGVLAAVNVAVYATASLAFLWPVMPFLDAGAVVMTTRRAKSTR